MVTEVLAGIALVKSAVKGVKAMIDTAKDVNDIAHHIDNLFKGQEQSTKRINKKIKGNQDWRILLSSRFKDEDEDVSFSQITSEVIEQKQIQEQMKAVERLLNRRFGAGTWYEILDLRDKRLKEQKETAQKVKENIKKRKKEEDIFWDNVWYWILELGKVSLIFLFAGLLIWWVIENRCIGAVC